MGPVNGLNACEGKTARPEPEGMIAQSVADILDHHVNLTIEGIDRMCLNIYVPRLQTEQGVVWFFRDHRGQPLPSAALTMRQSFYCEAGRLCCRACDSAGVIRKGERKDTVMAEHLRKFGRAEGVLLLGKAQEKTPVFRTETRRS